MWLTDGELAEGAKSQEWAWGVRGSRGSNDGARGASTPRAPEEHASDSTGRRPPVADSLTPPERSVQAPRRDDRQTTR